MKESKISKSEQKKLETMNRRSFTQRMFSSTLQTIPPVLECVRKKTRINIFGQNYNRYVRFTAYGKSCNILIYQDGNVAVVLDEACHDKFTAQMFAFTLDEMAQNAFENHFREVLGWLLPTFLESMPYDFHTFMDYVNEFQDIEVAHKWVENDFGTPPS
jgi:hypothetical protein